MSPGARAGAGSVGGRMKSEDLVQTTRRFRDRSFSQARQLVWQCGASPLHQGRPASPACRLRTFAASTVWKLQHPRMPWLSSLHLAVSRRRIECGSKISSSFRVLPRPSEEPIPALDVWRMPLDPESGNGGRGRLIHFRQECQWTRVDNSTGRRADRRLSPVALGEQPQAQRVELDEALCVLLIIGAGVVLERHVALGIQ